MSTATVKLRNDLVISRQDGSDGTIFVIKDPVTERYFRFKETEHFIAQQFDGATSPEIARKRFEGKFGATLSTENLEQFVNRLRGVGLLTDGEAAPSVQPSARKRVAGDLFYLRFKIFDPDRLFDWLIPRIQFLFTPYFVVLSAALVVGAAGVSVINWAEIIHQSGSLFRFESLALAWLVCRAVIAAHEFSHGLTCKYFGGRVREIGFLLIYFQPAFYCNVSDAWLFPEKSKRLWVTFAGAYFETFLWALATLAWRVTDPNSSLNHFALVVTVTSAIKWFFNMNPLIKLDGYYLLSDWLDAPNLRKKAFGYVGDQIRRLWGAASGRFAGITPRERRIYLIYALLAGTYSYWLLGNIVLWFAEFMVARYQGWGFVLFATTLGFLFRQPIRRSLSPSTTRVQPWLSKGAVLPKRAKIGLGFTALLAVFFFCRLELKVSAPFTVLPVRNAEIRVAVEGSTEEMYAAAGE